MDELTKNDIIETEITSLGINGEGVTRVNGKAVFIKGALVGEKVRAKIILVKPSFCVAIVEKILTPSPHRVAPLCPLFNKCGGCDIQHLSYDEQLKFKSETVCQTLKRVGGVEVEVAPTVASDKRYRYRNKVSFPVRQNKFGLQIGLFAKNSHRLIPVDDCVLQYEFIKDIVATIKNFIEKNGYRGYDEEKFNGDIRHIVIRTVSDLTTVTLVVTRPVKTYDLLNSLRKICPKCSLYLNINGRRDNVILGEEWIFIGGENRCQVDGLDIEIHPAGFFQVNDYIRSKIYDHACQLTQSGNAVEAYSGAGLLSAHLANSAKKVVGIEINRQAHESAVNLAKTNGINNMEPLCADVGSVLTQVIADLGDNTFIVVDPPRSGLDENACSALLDSGADKIVYISCNPATLARDCKILSQRYSVTSATPYDMFPHTSNVETVVVLQKQNA